MNIFWFDHKFSCPEGSAGTRTYILARGLVEAGHGVTVLCASDLVSNSGLKGTFRHDRREGTVDGIQVIEFDLAGGGSLVGRLRARVNFAAAIARQATSGRYDLTITASCSPPGVLAGLWARIIRGMPLILDVRSLRFRVNRALRIGNPIANAFAGLAEKCGYLFSGRIIAAGDDLAEAAISFGADRHKTKSVPYVSNGALFREADRTSLSRQFPDAVAPGNLVAIFAGRFEAEHGLGAVLDAAENLHERGRDDISILLIGDGPQRKPVIDALVRRKLTRVAVAKPMAARALPATLRSGDLGLAVVNGNPAVHGSVEAGGFCDYLAAGLPVLINYPGWAAGLVAQYDSGFAVRAGDSGAFADALEYAADHREILAGMASNARRLGEREFDAGGRMKEFLNAVDAAVTEAQTRARQRLKRALDVAIASLALALLSPLLMTMAVAIRLNLGSPVFFRETRPGLFGRPVELMRFRTRRDAYRPDGGLLSDDERQTAVGRLIEKLSASGLPLLWNVLRGDLSLVGPRVIPMQDLSRLSSRAFRRQFMRPGLVSPAHAGIGSQEDRLAQDLWYVENQSLKLDLRILANALLRALPKRSAPVSGDIAADESLTERRNDRKAY